MGIRDAGQLITNRKEIGLKIVGYEIVLILR